MKLTNAGLKKLLEKPGRHGDGDGLYFRTLGLGRAYWGYRYRTGGKEREMSLGPYPELSLIEARAKHAAVRKAVVVDKADPLADRVAAKVAVVKVPAFGQCADAYLQSHEAAWGNAKHRKQWAMTLTKYAAPIRDMPVDQVDAKAIRKVIEPMWNTIPRTADRLRGRIEAVLSSAQVGGHIDEDKPNPARWKDGSTRCSQAGEVRPRGHHTAMPYAELPAFMARLSTTLGAPAKALAFTILTAARSGEVLNATWTVPASRMKMGKPHAVPLSDEAVAILKALEATHGKSPYVFPGSIPRRPLSVMSLKMRMNGLGAGDYTPHGMRSAARSWMADNAVPFELAEACLAHAVGNAVVQADQRSSMLERRRPIMSAWANFVCAADAANVVALNGTRRRS
jgi:integrase